MIIATFFMFGCSTEDPKITQPGVPQESTQLEEGAKQQSIESEEVPESTSLEESEVQEKEEIEKAEDETPSKILDDIKNTKRYTTKMKMISNVNGQEIESFITNVVADGQTYSLMESDAGILEHIEKEDKSYLIMHDSKTILKSNRYEEEETDAANPALVYDDLEYIGKGQDIFLGKKRSYEEYKIEFGTVKYYFDGKDIDGMEIILDMDSILEDDEDYGTDEELFAPGEVTMIIDVLSFEKEADMSVFELPEDYQIIGE